MATATMKPPVDLAELVKLHQAGVWRYLHFLGCDESQADDLTQETFLAVWRKPFEQRSPAASAGYLRTVARNLFLLALRKGKRQQAIAQMNVSDEVYAEFARDDAGEGYLEALRACVERLEGRAQEAVSLFYREDRSRAYVAEALEMTEDGVKSLLRRTREVLRQCVERRLAD